MLRNFKVIGMLYTLLLLVACASLGLATPQTFNQKWVYALGSVTSVRVVAKDLLDVGKITSAEAGKVQEQANTARQFLDAARAASFTGDTSSAESKLLTAQGVLNTLNEFLKSRGGNL